MTSMGCNPPVSFITTCFNGGDVIEQAVRSMEAVDWPAKQIVLLNDGSTDRTAEICRALAADNPDITFLDRPRLGRGRALNEALAAACGTYIAINDADDVSLPHRLVATVPYLEDNPELGLLATDVHFVPHTEWAARLTALPDDTTTGRTLRWIEPVELYGENFIAASSIVFRHDVACRVGGFNERISCSIDYDFYFRVMTCARMAFLDFPTVAHRSGFAYPTFFRSLPANIRRRDTLSVLAFARQHFDIPLKKRIVSGGRTLIDTYKLGLRQGFPRAFAWYQAVKSLRRSLPQA